MSDRLNNEGCEGSITCGLQFRTSNNTTDLTGYRRKVSVSVGLILILVPTGGIIGRSYHLGLNASDHGQSELTLTPPERGATALLVFVVQFAV